MSRTVGDTRRAGRPRGSRITMHPLPLRLQPGDDLRAALAAAVAAQGCQAAFVLAGIGSLSATQLRLTGAEQPCTLTGDVEILTLSGSIAANGVHLHMSVADAAGRVLGGHVAAGCIVRTTRKRKRDGGAPRERPPPRPNPPRPPPATANGRSYYITAPSAQGTNSFCP